MAESLIAFTDGAGKNQHHWQRTISAVAVEDQLVIPGEHYVASYSALAAGIATTTSASHLIQLMADGTLYTRVRRIYVQQAALATTTTTAQLQVFRLTTAGTGGSAISARPYDTGDTNPYAGGVMTLPTVKGTEGNQLLQARLTLTQTQPTAAMNEWEWVARPDMKPIIIQPATTNGICVKIVTGIAGAQLDCTIEFVTTTFS